MSQAPARRWRSERWLPWALAAAWCAALVPFVPWGLPSRADDDLLFGGEPAWPAERFDAAGALDQLRSRTGGADTDLDPLAVDRRLHDLTASEADRAAILLRYRLYSHQPDEMIVFRALARMRPRAGDFDPQLYQYGGAYLYLVAAALVGAQLVGLVHLTGDLSYYLDAPEQFARMYVVARLVTLAFAGAGLVAVYRLAARAAGRTAGLLALALAAAAPVYLSGALEAKPHLPSAAMMLWALLAALDYRRSGRRRDALRLGLFAGLAFGLVLTGLLGAVILPALAMTISRERRRAALRHIALAGALLLAVYAATNPYVPYNAIVRPERLRGNLQNSLTMYEDRVSRVADGTVRTAVLLPKAIGWLGLAAGLGGVVLLMQRTGRAAAPAAVLGGAVLVMGALLGADKPDEFARFLAVPGILLLIAAAALLARVARWCESRASSPSPQPSPRSTGERGNGAAAAPVAVAPAVAVAVGAGVLMFTMNPIDYLRAFCDDARRPDRASRRVAGESLRGAEAVAVVQEPAPYSIPPLDFAHCRVVLLPRAAPDELDPIELPRRLVCTQDGTPSHADAWWWRYYVLERRCGETRAPITWANKAVEVYRLTGTALDALGMPATGP